MVVVVDVDMEVVLVRVVGQAFGQRVERLGGQHFDSAVCQRGLQNLICSRL